MLQNSFEKGALNRELLKIWLWHILFGLAIAVFLTLVLIWAFENARTGHGFGQSSGALVLVKGLVLEWKAAPHVNPTERFFAEMFRTSFF